jgi:hypothetical protein
MMVLRARPRHPPFIFARATAAASTEGSAQGAARASVPASTEGSAQGAARASSTDSSAHGAELLGVDQLTDDLLLIVLHELSGSLVDVAAVSVTCRRLHELVLANANDLCAAQTERLDAARQTVNAALEADTDPRAAPLAAVARALAGEPADEPSLARRGYNLAGEPSHARAERWVRGLLSGPCRVSDGAWCGHGLCTYRPLGPRARPGLAVLLEAAVAGATPGTQPGSEGTRGAGSGTQPGSEVTRGAGTQRQAERAGVVASALATMLEAVGAPRLALARWLVLAEQPYSSPRAQLRLALYYHRYLLPTSPLPPLLLP